jgi:hydroxymethylpyrimidine pyrophosphatase-like HAD family hydrolase
LPSEPAMRYFALATDYDGTLATDGRVDAATMDALRRLKSSGRRVVLVTGRRLDDLQHVFPEHAIFDRIVAENGAVLYDPTDKSVRDLEDPPPPELARALRARGVPLDVGHVILATWQPHEGVVLDTIREMGLELHLEFNKGAVMVMPAGVTKRTGLDAALLDLQLSSHNVVGVGDAENDHAFLTACECGVAVQNALPSLKDRADWITDESRGKGVMQLIDRLLEDDLSTLQGPRERHALFVGRGPDGGPVHIDPHRATVLVAGPSGSGKSTLATALVERVQDAGYQLCVVDPEGDHEKLEPLAQIGDIERAPRADEVEALLRDPRRSAVVSLLAVPLEERPRWFGVLRSRVHELRMQTGRPHWLVVDEAHHVMPAKSDAPLPQLPKNSAGMLLVTVNPESLARATLDGVTLLITTMQGAGATLRAFAVASGREAPSIPKRTSDSSDGTSFAVVWRVDERDAMLVEVLPPRHEHQRHKRKYATGDLGEDRSFVFRGPKGELHLRAQNLALFAQMAVGVDEGTWLHHLRAGDYSSWFREAIKDPPLAEEAAHIEKADTSSADESRDRILAAIRKRYTLPA